MKGHMLSSSTTSFALIDHDSACDIAASQGQNHPASLGASAGSHGESYPVMPTEVECISVTLSEFVRDKFVPDYVTSRKLAGRTHFQFILRLILTPEQVAVAFGIESQNTKPIPRSSQDWPYLGSMPLHRIDCKAIQVLTSAALQAGYSTQTAIHIRNVIRSIFGYARHTGHFPGSNPASLVMFPIMVRKAAPALTATQLQQAMLMMRYPEKEMALCAILTDMNFSEICGLTWKSLNLSSHPSLLNSELLPPKTIAVRYQYYRGEFRPVVDGKKRFIPIPNALFSSFCDLKSRSGSSDAHSFVFASRNGTPINPDNIGTRRLKEIGRVLDIPWLSWSVFHRTHVALKSQFGQLMIHEVERLLLVNDALVGNSRNPSLHQPGRGGISNTAVE